jgi:uncharacterized protein (TIGR02145 family)
MTQENTSPDGTTRLPDSGQTPSGTTRLPDSGQAGTGTARIADANNPGVPSGITNHEAQTNFIGGGLLKDEEIDGFKVISKIPKTTGEAEIYIASKGQEKAIIKYYYQNFNPKREILKDLLNIKHANIINVYGFGDYKGRFYEIQEYAAGGTLGDKNADGSYKYVPVTEEKAIEIVNETIDAFNYFHSKGIIHRDIKPDNIFFKNADGTDVLIGDFGISSALDIEGKMTKRITSTYAMTYGYAAPELFGVHDKKDNKMKLLVGPEVDYYALGITLYVALAAEDPFENRSAPHIMRDTIGGIVVDDLLTREKGKNISPKLKKLIRGLLVVRHDKRWKYEDVIRHLNGEEVEVYAEQIQTQIPQFIFSESKTINSLNELAQAISEDRETGKKFLFRGMIEDWLKKFNQALANKVIDLKEKYGRADTQMYGLERLIYLLNPGIPLTLDNNSQIKTLSDFELILKNKPQDIVKYLRDENSRFYAWAEENELTEYGESIKELSSLEKDDIRFVKKIILSKYINSYKPFEDKGYNDVTITSVDNLLELPNEFKKFVIEYLNDINSNLYIWIELQKGTDNGEKISRGIREYLENEANSKSVLKSFLNNTNTQSGTLNPQQTVYVKPNSATITFGTQEWTTENLNVDRYRNGDIIPQVQDIHQWENLKTGAWCYCENKADNGNKYGKLYNWYAVNDPRGLAPKGWHIPSDAEWTQLADYLGGEEVAGGKLKATTLWDTPNTGATNESGFKGLLGGCNSSLLGYSHIGEDGNFWTASEDYDCFAWYRSLGYDSSDMLRINSLMTDGMSIRCVRDFPDNTNAQSGTLNPQQIVYVKPNSTTITIGKQEWTTENLNIEHYRNGNLIPQVQDSNQWYNIKTGAWCYYENKADNGNKYGKLYNWYAVNDPRGLAPKGWHIPSDAEWTQLTNFLGGEKVAGGKLKATTLWDSPNTGATNESGFTAFPGGTYDAFGFCGIGGGCYFWSSSNYDDKVYYRKLFGYDSGVYRNEYYKNYGLSVRCVRD